jgi:hypothetical protein
MDLVMSRGVFRGRRKLLGFKDRSEKFLRKGLNAGFVSDIEVNRGSLVFY